MLATPSTPRAGSSCSTSRPLWRPCTSPPPGRSTREAGLTASPRPGTEETEETEEVEGEEGEAEEEEETTGGLGHLRGTGMMTGTGGGLPTVVVTTTTTLPAVEVEVEVVMMDGVVDLLAGVGEEVGTMEVVEVADTMMMITVATMITAGVDTPGEKTRKINSPTIWNISCPRTTLWLPGLCSSATWS